MQHRVSNQTVFISFRFKDLTLEEENLILYVGGNTNGVDGVNLMKICPKW